MKPTGRVKIALEQFIRNGRWGTCVDCPRDGNGRQLPELCKFTERCDHLLDLNSIVFQYDLDVKDSK